MRIIFLEDIPKVARTGEMREVADGYARNYLIPKKLAVEVTPANVATIQAQIKARARLEARSEAEIIELANQLEGKEVTLKVKVGAKDRLYGSITSADITAELEKSAGLLVDKRKIELPEPIKKLGIYDVPITLAAEVVPKIKVNVIREETS